MDSFVSIIPDEKLNVLLDKDGDKPYLTAIWAKTNMSDPNDTRWMSLWELVRQHIKGGNAVLIFSTNNEQGFNIRTSGLKNKRIVDIDGIIMVESFKDNDSTDTTPNRHWSNAYWKRHRK